MLDLVWALIIGHVLGAILGLAFILLCELLWLYTIHHIDKENEACRELSNTSSSSELC